MSTLQAHMAYYRLVVPGEPVWPVWADRAPDATHDDCEAGGSLVGTSTACSGPMYLTSVEDDIALLFCEAHAAQHPDLQPIDVAAYDLLVEQMRYPDQQPREHSVLCMRCMKIQTWNHSAICSHCARKD